MTAVAHIPLTVCGHPSGSVDVGQDGSIVIVLSPTDMGRDLYNSAAAGLMHEMQLMPRIDPARPSHY